MWNAIGRRHSGVCRRVFNKYADDEANTRAQTVMLMLIGGGKIAGIHGNRWSEDPHPAMRRPTGGEAKSYFPGLNIAMKAVGRSRLSSGSDSKPDFIEALPKCRCSASIVITVPHIPSIFRSEQWTRLSPQEISR